MHCNSGTEARTAHAQGAVDGTVQQLAVHTIGGVVTPAQQLVMIVPKGAGLEIETTLANKDVGFVHKGQEVEVKVEAFTFMRYGRFMAQSRASARILSPRRTRRRMDANQTARMTQRELR